MSDRITWDDAPPVIEAAVQNKLGPISRAETVLGARPGLAARLHGEHGSAFVKAVRLNDDGVGLYWREQHAAQLLGEWAPAPPLLWEMQVDGWLILAWELVNDHARHVRLHRGSPDLPWLLDALGRLVAEPLTGQPSTAAKRYRNRWQSSRIMLDLSPGKLGDYDQYMQAFEHFSFESLDGASAIIHEGLGRRNLLIKDRRVVAVDWSQWCVGGWWINLATIAPSLMVSSPEGEGHSAQEADALLYGVTPLWGSAPRQAVAGLAAVDGLFHLERATFGPESRREEEQLLAEATREWLAYRLK
jgi:hypothetical protein